MGITVAQAQEAIDLANSATSIFERMAEGDSYDPGALNAWYKFCEYVYKLTIEED